MWHSKFVLPPTWSPQLDCMFTFSTLTKPSVKVFLQLGSMAIESVCAIELYVLCHWGNYYDGGRSRARFHHTGAIFWGDLYDLDLVCRMMKRPLAWPANQWALKVTSQNTVQHSYLCWSYWMSTTAPNSAVSLIQRVSHFPHYKYRQQRKFFYQYSHI